MRALLAGLRQPRHNQPRQSRARNNEPRDNQPRNNEHGAAAVVLAAATAAIVGIAAFAVDIGTQRVAARDMQAVADAAALDAARLLPTCDATALTTAANRTKTRQGEIIGNDQPLTAVPGHLDPTTREFRSGARNGACDAVQVTSATSVARAFVTGNGPATRSAVGTRGTPSMCFSVGTNTLTLNTSQSALGPLLDSILRVNLNVIGYGGLVDLKNLSVPLLDIATELGVGTPQELLALNRLSLARLMLATATVLSRQGNTAQATVLQTIAAQVGAVTLNVAKILDLGTGGDAGLRADLNALDLIGAAIVAANGTNSLRIDSLSVTLPANLVNAQASLVVTEPPKIACGTVGARASSAQVRLDLSTGINAVGIAGVFATLGVRVGSGSATLSSIQCTGANPAVTFSPITTAAASVVGYQDVGAANVRVSLLPSQYLNLVSGLLFLLLAPLGLNLTLDVGVAAQVGAGGPFTRTTTYPAAPGLAPRITVGADQLLTLNTVSIVLAQQGLLGGLLGALLNPLLSVLTSGIVTPLINTVVSPLLSSILIPTLRALGIRLGVTEIDVLGRPACAAVQLIS